MTCRGVDEMCDNDGYGWDEVFEDGEFIEQIVDEDEHFKQDPQQQDFDEILDISDMDTEEFDPGDLW